MERVDADDLYASDGEASISGEWPRSFCRNPPLFPLGQEEGWKCCTFSTRVRVSHAETIHFNICHSMFVYAHVSMRAHVCKREREVFSTRLS